MFDIGDVCNYCETRHCEACVYGNPCLGCPDYSGHHVCLSKGGCMLKKETDKQDNDEVKNERSYLNKIV